MAINANEDTELYVPFPFRLSPKALTSQQQRRPPQTRHPPPTPHHPSHPLLTPLPNPLRLPRRPHPLPNPLPSRSGSGHARRGARKADRGVREAEEGGRGEGGEEGTVWEGVSYWEGGLDEGGYGGEYG